MKRIARACSWWATRNPAKWIAPSRLLRFCTPPVLLAIMLTGALSQVSFADVQQCNDPDGAGSSCNPACPPAVNYLSPSLLDADSLGNGVWALTFLVSVSGSGYHGNSALPFKVDVTAQSDSAMPITGSYSSGNDLPADYGATCYTITYTYCHSTTARNYVRFWAKAFETVNGAQTCVCYSDTFYINFPFTPTSAPGVGPALASEQGPPTCPFPEGNPIGVGDPINVTNGNMYLQRNDVEIPTDRGLALLLDRHYNSAETSAGKLGAKWRLGIEQSLSVNGTTGDITLKEGNGRSVLFTKHTLDFNTGQVTSYSPPFGAPYALNVNAAPNPDVYTIRLPDNTKLVIDGAGAVDSILDLTGNRIRLHYTAGGALDTVENAAGRKVIFLDSSGLLRRIKSIPGDTLLVRYEYNVSNLLKKVVYPDGGSEDYGYGTNGYDAQSITSAVTSDGVSRHWSYDSNGMANHFHYGADSSEAVTFLDRDTSEYGCAGSPLTLRSVVKHGKNSLQTDYLYAWSPDR